VASETVMNDLVNALKHNTFAQIVAIQEMYRYEQFKEANKVAPIWKPYTVMLPANMTGDPINVFPRNPKRSGFVLQNASTSSGAVTYSSRPFNIAEVTAVLANSSQGVIDAGTLQVGATMSIVTSGPLFVATGAAAATLEIVETIYGESTFDSSDTTPAGQHWSPSGRIEGFLNELAKELV
jgi:hypothetical protein